MLSQIRPAFVLLAAVHRADRPRLSARDHRRRASRPALSGQRQLLIGKDGAPIGSALIGQNFASDKYFHGRPSATQAQDPAHPDDSSKTIDAPYNAANSTGSNLGPTSQKLVDRVKADVAAKRAAGWSGPIPADAVTTSASGLDPDISPQTALGQVPAVAKARGLERREVAGAGRGASRRAASLGLIGEPRVNVLRLNIALDAL